MSLRHPFRRPASDQSFLRASQGGLQATCRAAAQSLLAWHTSSTPLSWDTRSRGHRQAPVKRNAKPSVLCFKATSCLRSHLSQLPENHPKPYLPQLQSNILHSKPKTPTSRPEPPKPWWPPCLGLLEHGEGVREDLQRSSSPRKRSIGQDTGRPDTRQFESRREDDSMTGSLLLLSACCCTRCVHSLIGSATWPPDKSGIGASW